MSTRNIKISIVSLLLAILAMFTLVIGLGTNKGTKAEEAVFQFETTAYAKVTGNGGLRFRLKMNKAAKDAIGTNSITMYAASWKHAAEANTSDDWDVLNTENKAWKNEIAASRIYNGSDGYYYVNYLLDINSDAMAALGSRSTDTDFAAFATVGDYTAKSEPAGLASAVAYAVLYGYGDEVAEIYSWFYEFNVDETVVVEDKNISGKYDVTDFDYTSNSEEYVLALVTSKYTIEDLKQDIGEFKFEISDDLKLTCEYGDAVKAKLGDDESKVIAAIESCKIEKLSDVLATATFTIGDLKVEVYLEKVEGGFTSCSSVTIDGVKTDITFNFVKVTND